MTGVRGTKYALVFLVFLGLALPVIAGQHEVAPTEKDSGRPRLLLVVLEGDSLDFVLTDPVGRVGIMAVDSAFCSIPRCTATKSSDMAQEDHDDSDTTSVGTVAGDHPAYGGGNFSLVDPEPGTWYVEARAGRPCPDSCEVGVGINHIGEIAMDVSQSVGVKLLAGQSVRWSLTMAPRSKRIGRPWAYLSLERGPHARGGPKTGQGILTWPKAWLSVSVQADSVAIRLTDQQGRHADWNGTEGTSAIPGCDVGPEFNTEIDSEDTRPTFINFELDTLAGPFRIRVMALKNTDVFLGIVGHRGQGDYSCTAYDGKALRRGALAEWAASLLEAAEDTCWISLNRVSPSETSSPAKPIR